MYPNNNKYPNYLPTTTNMQYQHMAYNHKQQTLFQQQSIPSSIRNHSPVKVHSPGATRSPLEIVNTVSDDTDMASAQSSIGADISTLENEHMKHEYFPSNNQCQYSHIPTNVRCVNNNNNIKLNLHYLEVVQSGEGVGSRARFNNDEYTAYKSILERTNALHGTYNHRYLSNIGVSSSYEDTDVGDDGIKIECIRTISYKNASIVGRVYRAHAPNITTTGSVLLYYDSSEPESSYNEITSCYQRHQPKVLTVHLSQEDMQITKVESIASMKNTVKNKNIELVGKEEEIKSVNTALLVSNTMLKSRDEDILMLKDDLKNKNEALKNKNDQIIAKDEEITSLVTDCSNCANGYEKMSKDLKVKDAEIESLKDTLKKKNDQIAANLLNKISSLQTTKDEEIATLKHTLENKNIELTEIEAEIESVNGQYVKLDEHIKQLSEKDEEIAWLGGALMNKDDQIAAKDEEIASLTIVCPPSKRRRTQHQPKVLTVHLSQEYTTCGICQTKYSTDINNKDDNIRKHLPVISASSKSCDHYFCHGCILKQQASIAEENGGKIPRWIPCMICRTKTAFCPSEPKYHRMLIDILREAKWSDAPLVKEERVSD